MPFALRPLLRRVIQHVEGPKPLRVLVLEVLPLALQEDVFLREVAEHERYFGLVVGVLEDRPRELVHGCYAGAAGDEGDVLVLVGRPRVFGDGPFEVEALGGFHVVEMFGHGAVVVALDYEINEAAGVCGLGKLVGAYSLYIKEGSTDLRHWSGCMGG